MVVVRVIGHWLEDMSLQRSTPPKNGTESYQYPKLHPQHILLRLVLLVTQNGLISWTTGAGTQKLHNPPDVAVQGGWVGSLQIMP